MANRINIDSKDFTQVFDKLIEKFSKFLGRSGVEIINIFKTMWPVLVKQARVDAAVSLVQAVALLGLGIPGFFAIHRFLVLGIKTIHEDCVTSNWWITSSQASATWWWVGLVLLYIVAIVFFIAVVMEISTILTGFINPEYKAIEDLVEKIRSLIPGKDEEE